MSTNSIESESSIILPSISNISIEHSGMMCEEDGAAVATKKSGKPTRRVSENTQGALDALVSFSTTAVNKSALQQQDQIIPSHQTQTSSSSSSSDEDSESMPPPPPRSPTTMLAARDLLSGASRCSVEPISVPQPSFTFLHDSTRFSNMDAPNYTSSSTTVGRLRSASNPEGTEKWDLYSRRNDRQHFVLPSSILEEELASIRHVLGEDPDDNGEYTTTDTTTTITTAAVGFQQHWSTTGVRKSKRNIARLGRLGTSPDSVSDDLVEEDETSTPLSSRVPNKKSSSNNSNSKTSKKKSSSSKQRKKLPPKLISKSPPPDELEDDDEESLEPEELLRRARTRLLEDLSEGGGENRAGAGMNGGVGSDKNDMMILPHSLSKYKEVSLYMR